MKKTLRPQILVFDVDGVLVDVRGTYWRSALDTVRYLTGKRVTFAELHQWKSKRSEEHTSELQSQSNLVCRLLLEKKTARRCHMHASLCHQTVNVRESISSLAYAIAC